MEIQYNTQVMFDNLIDQLIEYETWSLFQLGLKLAEETGELAEHVFVEGGLKDKVLSEPIECEAADVINCAIAISVRSLASKGLNNQEIKDAIYEGIRIKNDKYLKLLTKDNPLK